MPPYADIINQLAQTAGIYQDKSPWSYCDRNNGTYMDCPT